MAETHLTACMIAEDNPLAREAPRPAAMRRPDYAQEFDWKTLFYDVYRSGDSIVMQGPPLRNLAAQIGGNDLVSARRIERPKGSELWIDGARPNVTFTLGEQDFDITPGASLTRDFAGRRVLITLNKDNELAWIRDWIHFHHRLHGTDGVLIYDNGSSRYHPAELEAQLSALHADVFIRVVSWPFKYGPQGGGSGSIDGMPAPWDSDFCQAGMLQHARFRYLAEARSVLNLDIDEMLVSHGGQSIHEITECCEAGVVHFDGLWVSAVKRRKADRPRHRHFVERDEPMAPSARKWCAVPKACEREGVHWTTHLILGSEASTSADDDFRYRHFRSISTNWKYDRSARAASATVLDVDLARDFAKAFPFDPAASPSNPDRPTGSRADTTVVLTSCGRHDLLDRTLSSFRQWNSYDGIDRVIVVEDGGDDPSAICEAHGAHLLRCVERVGQIAAIEKAYALVRTPYIFHLEDDWEFYRPGFIEQSKGLLEADPSLICVWLRSWADTNRHPIAEFVDGGRFGYMERTFNERWHGFTFNPGLRRLSDYERIKPFSASLDPKRLDHEAQIGQIYFDLGYRAAITDERGYVRHIGWGRHVG